MATPRPRLRDVSPNRLKFVSLVQKLDPRDPAFAAQIAELEAGFQKRADIMRKLGAVLQAQSAELGKHLPGYRSADPKTAICSTVLDELLNAMESAIERFVVDRY